MILIRNQQVYLVNISILCHFIYSVLEIKQVEARIYCTVEIFAVNLLASLGFKIIKNVIAKRIESKRLIKNSALFSKRNKFSIA